MAQLPHSGATQTHRGTQAPHWEVGALTLLHDLLLVLPKDKAFLDNYQVHSLLGFHKIIKIKG